MGKQNVTNSVDLELIADDELLDELNRRHETALFLGLKSGHEAPATWGNVTCSFCGQRHQLLGLAESFVAALRDALKKPYGPYVKVPLE